MLPWACGVGVADVDALAILNSAQDVWNKPVFGPIAAAGDEAVLWALRRWQHPIGINADARGLAQHRPVVEQQHRSGQNRAQRSRLLRIIASPIRH